MGALRHRLSQLKWRFWWNAAATRAWLLRGEKPRGPLEKRMARDLERDGVAVCQAAELLGDPGLVAALAAEVARIEGTRAEEIAAIRDRAGEKTARKSFLFEVLGSRPELDPDSIFGRICLAEPILRIAASYLGLFPELRYLNVWRNFRSAAPAQRSQLWHRDRDDKRMVKAFLYLSEVGPGSGPLIYAKGTHARGPITADPESFKEEGHGNARSEDDQMAKVVPEKDWIVCTVGAGTLVLCDTSGYHRGGLARDADRLALTFMYVSPAAECPTLLERKAANATAKASPAVAWALGTGA